MPGDWRGGTGSACGVGDTADGAQGHQPVQALLLRVAHNSAKFSVMAFTTLLLGTASVSSGTTRLSVHLVHEAQFKSAHCESTLGAQGDTAGAVAARAAPPGQGVPPH